MYASRLSFPYFILFSTINRTIGSITKTNKQTNAIKPSLKTMVGNNRDRTKILSSALKHNLIIRV